MPKEIAWVQCGNKLNIAPCVLLQRVEKIASEKNLSTYTVADYVASYKCQTCMPTKGRRANPENAKIPKTATCGCGAVININPYQLKAKAQKLNTTIEELIKGFKCQKCSPTHRGRPRKS